MLLAALDGPVDLLLVVAVEVLVAFDLVLDLVDLVEEHLLLLTELLQRLHISFGSGGERGISGARFGLLG